MESYDVSKNYLQDLQPFPTFRMVFTILQKILQKTVFMKLDRSRGIEHQSKTLSNRSNRYRALIESGRNFKSIFLINSIDWTKVLTDRTTWNLNFHKENFRSRNIILFILQMNTLQPYLIITTYPCIYLYIQHWLVKFSWNKNSKLTKKQLSNLNEVSGKINYKS